MSIASRQIKKELNKIIENKMKAGFVPSIEYIITELSRYYQRVRVGFPSLQLRKQVYRKPWSIDKYNNNLIEIYDDINNLYEEMIDQFTIVLTNFDYYDTERRRLLHTIKSLDSKIDSLLLIAEDTEGYLYSVNDYFYDRSKIDLENSTCEINTDSGIITLKECKNGISKIDMSHYFDVINFPLVEEEVFSENIVANKLFPNSKFGYAFSDVSTAWAQEVISKVNGELRFYFIVELNPSDTSGTSISRIEMLGHSPSPMLVEPKWSTDNINFFDLPLGKESGARNVSDDKNTVWNFNDIGARYVKFNITKSVADDSVGSSNVPQYRYNIGFRNIEFFVMSYDKSSVFYSLGHEVINPNGTAITVNKVSLDVDNDIPSGTSVDYYVSLGSDIDSVEIPDFEWSPISPINEVNPKEQQVVDFKNIEHFLEIPQIIWDDGSYATPLETYNMVSFYKVYQFPYEPLQDTVILYRGKDNWAVKQKYEVKRVAIYDEEHSFESASTVTLTYPDFTPVEGNGLTRGSIVVKSEPGINPSHTYISGSDYTINYTTKVITKTTGSNISSDSSATSNTIYVDYQYDQEIAEPNEYSTYVYIVNKEGSDVNIVPFNVAEINAGQFLRVLYNGETIDLSSESFYTFNPGWTKVTTTAQPQSASDRFYSVNDNSYLVEKVHTMYAFAEPLQQVNWFDLKYNTLKSDHTRYAIVDYDGDGNKEIIVNYNPQTSAWVSSSDDLLCPNSINETYSLQYGYISREKNTVYLKADISRKDESSARVTPTIKSYTLKIGH